MGPEVWGGVLSLAVAMAGCSLIVATRHLHGRVTGDARSGGRQKISKNGAPRIGGVAIYIGILVAAGTMSALGKLPGEMALLLTVPAIPTFAGGLLEDVVKNISAGVRLRLAFVSAAIAFFLVDTRVLEVGIPYFDLLLGSVVVSFAFTILAVGGMSHAMNIIDGFDGLLGGCALLMLAGISIVAGQVGDDAVLAGALIVAGAVLGFLLLNYPNARLLAGDGGAYLVGFLIAGLAVLLVHRNSEVSPWFALTVLLYPIFETIFSIYRKLFLREQSPAQPDGLHLHMLIHKRLVRLAGPDPMANPLTSPYLWALCAAAAIPATLLWSSGTALQVTAVCFALLYVWLYASLVRFGTPRLLAIRRLRRHHSRIALLAIENVQKRSA